MDHGIRHGIRVAWKRSPIQPVPDWADKCDLMISDKCLAVGGNINAVSARVSWVNAKLLWPCKSKYRKKVRMKHICRDCREALRPEQRKDCERWQSVKAERQAAGLQAEGGKWQIDGVQEGGGKQQRE